MRRKSQAGVGEVFFRLHDSLDRFGRHPDTVFSYVVHFGKRFIAETLPVGKRRSMSRSTNIAVPTG